MKTHLYLLTILFISVPSVFAQEIEKETVPGQEPTLVERLTGGKKVIESAEMNFQLYFGKRQFHRFRFRRHELQAESCQIGNKRECMEKQIGRAHV